jgi:hypothetical protein
MAGKRRWNEFQNQSASATALLVTLPFSTLIPPASPEFLLLASM